MGYSHGVKYDDNMIERKIFEVMKSLDIKRMPTSSEIEMIMGDTSLTNKISRSGGFKYWANKLLLEIKSSETEFGNKWELEIKSMLESMGYNVLKMTTKHAYDLLVNSNIKIDIKSSKCYNNGTSKYHSFNLGKIYHNCDIFICVGLDDDDRVEKLLIIPSTYLMGIKQLSIGSESKYDKFNEAYAYLSLYDIFYKNFTSKGILI